MANLDLDGSTEAARMVHASLLDPVVDYFRPRRVILFGSMARGESGSDSDYDLMVILDDDAPPDKLSLAAGFDFSSFIPAGRRRHPVP